jgi:hypothetical protein
MARMRISPLLGFPEIGASCQRHGNHSANGWPAFEFQVILHFAFCTLHLTAGLPWYTRHKTRNPESG